MPDLRNRAVPLGCGETGPRGYSCSHHYQGQHQAFNLDAELCESWPIRAGASSMPKIGKEPVSPPDALAHISHRTELFNSETDPGQSEEPGSADAYIEEPDGCLHCSHYREGDGPCCTCGADP